MMIRVIGAAALVLLARPALGQQDTLRLSALHEAAVLADPRVRQLELHDAAIELRLRNLSAERLPRLSLTGDASLQSEVAAIPVDLPEADIPLPPKDRYEAAVGADWLLYDGGALGARRGVAGAELDAAQARVVAALHPLRVEVNEAFFGALLLQERAADTGLVVQDLRARLVELRAEVVEGAALPGDTAAIRSEMLRSIQQLEELAAERRAAMRVLAELTGTAAGDGDVLVLPDLGAAVDSVRSELPEQSSAGTHPQYAVFAAERVRLAREEAVIGSGGGPQASAFGRVAYGSPGLEQFTHELHEYWIAGLRLDWRPWDWGSRARGRQALRIQQEIVRAEEEAFTARLGRQVRQPLETIQRLEGTLGVDDEIIVLREQIVRQVTAQLQERVIPVSGYVDALTDLQAARVARITHQVELARARADYLTTLGVELP
jgi:outer membrane protein TolC